jgi:esterase/lipase superfamily enzyme
MPEHVEKANSFALRAEGRQSGRLIDQQSTPGQHGSKKHLRRHQLHLALGLLVLFVFLLPPLVYGQDAPQGFQSDFSACRTPVTSAEFRQLNQKKEQDQKKIDGLQQRLKRNDVASTKEGESDRSDLKQAQADLLVVLERLECEHLGQLNDAVLRGPAGPKPSFVEIKVNYATDRVASPSESDPGKRFSGKLDADFQDFSFGTLRITIPTVHKPGELNLPSFWEFVSQPDPSRFFTIEDLQALNRETFMRQLGATDADQESNLLLFVHGFNVTFEDAALRTAQLAHDLQFRGKAMFYSWPSAGTVTGYWEDEDSSRISAQRFEKLLADLLAVGFKHIYIITHSMGSRVVIPSVNNLAGREVDVSKISELILAAPDFNEIEFKDIASAFERLRTKGTHVTIYASSNDFALRVSRIIHSYRRLGQSDPPMDTFPGLDSIDASMIAPMRRAYGHSYVCDSAAVIGDMEDIVLHGLAPQERGLLAIPKTPFGWTFQK